MVCCIVVLPGSQARADELEIDAKEITGETGTVLEATEAELRHADGTLNADLLRYDTEGGWVQAEGNVRLRDKGDNLLQADLLSYYPLLSKAVAEGKVNLQTEDGQRMWTELLRYEIDRNAVFVDGGVRIADNKGLEITGDSIEYFLDKKSGTLVGVALTKASELGHGHSLSAARMVIAPGSYELDEATYTTCMPADPAWLLEADGFKLDRTNQAVVATNAKLTFKGLPVLYLPSFSYSLSDERRSGFLAPSAAYKSGGEYSVAVPYYFNLAPNYDLLAEVELISNRGLYSTASGRWLMPDLQGSASGGLIGDSELDDDRGFLRLRNSWAFASDSNLELHAEMVSDDEFPGDFFEGDETAQRHFAKRLALTRQSEDWHLGVKIEDFQTIGTSAGVVAEPYSSLPSVTGGYRSRLGEIDVVSRGGITSFRRAADDPNNGVRIDGRVEGAHEGQLLGVLSSKARLGVASAYYEANDANWVAPYGSIELSRAFLSDSWFGGRDLVQSIKPRLMLGVVGRQSYEDVPVYDTRRTELNVIDMYRINPFAGADRFEDSNILTYGVDSRLWQRGAGSDYFSGRVAQQYRFAASGAQANNEPPPSSGLSNIIAEGRFDPNSRFTYLSRVEWNPDIDTFEQADLETQYRSDRGHAYVISYTRNSEDRSVNGGLGLQVYQVLNANLQLVGDLRYDLADENIGKIETGMKYISDCRCWEVDVFVDHSPQLRKDQTSVFVQFEFTGLGELGSRRFDELRDSIRTRI